MGSITRSFANNIGTSGILKAGAFNNASLNNVTALNAAIATGNMILISSQTASNSASISFTTSIDSTYKEYQFWFVDIHPSNDAEEFQFNLSTDSGSNYNVTKTTTVIRTYHYEDDSGDALEYRSDSDLAQSTADQFLSLNSGNNNDDSVCGSLTLFNPSSTTYVKHFLATVTSPHQTSGPLVQSFNVGGYGNTTSAVNAIRFKFSAGNIDAGTILMYGIK